MKKRFAYTERLRAMKEKKDILVASHRGSIGVNIPDNTKESFSIALRDGKNFSVRSKSSKKQDACQRSSARSKYRERFRSTVRNCIPGIRVQQKR